MQLISNYNISFISPTETSASEDYTKHSPRKAKYS